jgi:hypothetical protein
MAINLFDDGKVEIVCPRCGCTSPGTTAWIRANSRYPCPACNAEIILDEDKKIAELNEPIVGSACGN